MFKLARTKTRVQQTALVSIERAGPVFFLVAICSQSGYKNWPKANSGHIPCSTGPGIARYGHIQWRKEVDYSHQVAMNFAKKGKL